MAQYDLGTARGVIELDASSLGRASAAFTELGRNMLLVGGAAIAAFAYVVKTAADFEQTLSAVQAVTKATADQMEILREKALTLATGSVFSAGEIARAFEDLGKAGISVEEITGGAADAVVKLAAAAGDELPGGIQQGAEIIANAMKTFQVSSDQAERFANVLVAAAASSTLSVDDMATSFRYAGPIANELGLSIEDLSAILAILGDRGIKGSTAGTSLRGVLLSLTPTSDKAAAAMKDLGLITADGANKFYDLQGNLKPIPEVMRILKEATKGLSEEQKVQAFNTIFQRRAMNAALILADLGAEGFDRYAEAIAGLTAADIAATKLDNLSGDMKILGNTVDAFIIRVGEPLQAPLRTIVQLLTGWIESLSKLDPQLLSTIAQIVGWVGVVLSVLGAMSLFLALLIRMYRVFKDVSVAIGILTKAFNLLSLSFLLNPWTLLALAVIAVGAALIYAYETVQPFADAVDNAFAAVKSFVMPIIDGIVAGIKAMAAAFSGEDVNADGFIGVMAGVGEAARALVDWIQNTGLPGIQGFFRTLSGEDAAASGDTFVGFMERAGVVVREVAAAIINLGGIIITWLRDTGIPIATEFGQKVVEVVGAAVDWLINTGIPAFVSFAQNVIDKVGAAASWLNDNVLPVFVAFGALVAAVIEKIIGVINFFAPEFQAAFDIVMTVLSIAGQAVEFFWRLVETLFREFGPVIIDIVVTTFEFIKSVIEAGLRIILGIIQLITGIITGDWSLAWEGIKNILGGAVDAMLALVKEFAGALQNTLALLSATLWTIWVTLWDAVKTVLSVAWEFIVAVVTTAVERLVGLLQNLASLAVSTVQDMASRLIGLFQDAFWNMLDITTRVGQSILDWFAALPSNIVSFVGDLSRTLYDAGWNLISGFFDGIKDAVVGLKDKVVGAVETAVGWVADLIPGSPVKHGPLRVLNNGRAGRQIVTMLAEGVERERPMLDALFMNVVPTLPLGHNTGITTGVPMPKGGDGIDYNQLAAVLAAAVPTQPMVGELNVTSSDPQIVRDLDLELSAISRRRA